MKIANNGQESYIYKIGGTLSPDEPCYVTREGDQELYAGLKKRDFCYVLNSRQMGKSSLAMRILERLEDDQVITAYLDLQGTRTEEEKWYNNLICELADELCDYLPNHWETKWIESSQSLSPCQKLGNFLEKIILESNEIQKSGLVIFIDEIDYVRTLDFSTDSFFTLIRSCYNARSRKIKYRAVTFCLLGVATPSDLIDEKHITPFNIGTAITLDGFKLDEVAPLIKGLEPHIDHPRAMMKEILYWTEGQPFLTQRVCDLVVNQGTRNPNLTELINTNIIENWNAPEQDKQEHLRTISNRILSNEKRAGLLLELYREVLTHDKIIVSNTREERELQLSGLVIKRGNILEVYNPIYAHLFNESWIDQELGKLRPYAESYRAWIQSEKSDASRLLRGQALEEGEKWAAGKNLGGEDRDFLSASRAKERTEEIERKDKEAVERRNTILEEANRKANQRIKIGSSILGIMLCIAGGLGWWAWQQQGEALEAQRQEELALQKAQEAEKNTQQAILEIQTIKRQGERETLALQNQLNNLKQKVTLSNQKLQDALNKERETEERLLSATQTLEKAEEKKVEAERDKKKALNAVNQANKQRNDAVQQREQILANIRVADQLSKQAGILQQNKHPEPAKDALAQAGLSLTLKDSQLKQALSWTGISLTHQYLGQRPLETRDKKPPSQIKYSPEQIEHWQEAEKAIIESLKLLKKEKDLTSSQALPVAVFTYSVLGNLLEETAFAKRELNQDLITMTLPSDVPQTSEEAYGTAISLIPKNPDLSVDLPSLSQDNVDIDQTYRELWSALQRERIKKNEDDSLRQTRDNLENLTQASLKKRYAYQVNEQMQELERVLHEKKWKDADRLTWKILVSSAYSQDINEAFNRNMSCQALRQMDSLWLNESRGKFGFSPQLEAYKETGNEIGTYNELTYREFGEKVGWRKNREWLRYSELSWDKNAPSRADVPKGHHPVLFDTNRWSGRKDIIRDIRFQGPIFRGGLISIAQGDRVGGGFLSLSSILCPL